MKNTRNFWSTLLILIAIILVSSNSCKKDDDTNPTNGKSTAVFNPNITYGSMTDQDGNTYKTVKIGAQTWMAENLRTTKFRNGEAIPITIEFYWDKINTPVYGHYMDIASYAPTYGRLYNWYAVTDSRNIAPQGWHVPTYNEWRTLYNYLGGNVSEGGVLKETDTIHWNSPNTGATNETGFTALPAGYIGDKGPADMGKIALWWSITEWDYYTEMAHSCILKDYINYFNTYESYKYCGCSVRCIKDSE